MASGVTGASPIWNKINSRHWPSVQDFTHLVQSRRKQFRDLLLAAKSAGTVAGYTAPAKATVIANYCGLDATDLAFIVDDSKLKQGKWLPLTTPPGIPIVSSQYLDEHPVDTLVLWAWNQMELADKALTRGWCRQVLVPMPEPRFIKSPAD